MNVKEILENLVASNEQVLLCDSKGDWEAGCLLETLSPLQLRCQAHLQPGLYIAEINESGYLGRVLFRIKPGNGKE